MKASRSREVGVPNRTENEVLKGEEQGSVLDGTVHYRTLRGKERLLQVSKGKETGLLKLDMKVNSKGVRFRTILLDSPVKNTGEKIFTTVSQIKRERRPTTLRVLGRRRQPKEDRRERRVGVPETEDTGSMVDTREEVPLDDPEIGKCVEGGQK